MAPRPPQLAIWSDVPYDLTADAGMVVYRHRGSVEGPQGVYSLDIAHDGSPVLLMADSDFYFATECRFSPDGTKLAYLRGFSDIWVLNLSTGEQTEVTFTGGNANGPDWDPSGRYIVYERPLIPYGAPESLSGLRFVDTETLLDSSLRHNGKTTFGSNPRWSPDSTTIAFELIEPWNGVPGGRSAFHILTVSLIDGTYRELTSNDRRNNEYPIWLNNSELLFESFSEQTFNVHETQVIRYDGSQRQAWPVDLRPYLVFMAAAPQKNLYAYTGPDSTQTYGVLLLRNMNDTVGSTIRQLTKFTPLSPPASAPAVATLPRSSGRD